MVYAKTAHYIYIPTISIWYPHYIYIYSPYILSHIMGIPCRYGDTVDGQIIQTPIHEL